MKAVRVAITPQTIQSTQDYRLSDDPFYFKFCRSDYIDPDDKGMAKGLYVPALDLERFVESEESKGPAGGCSIGFDTIKRRFPNSLFVDLARMGWIGSRKIGTERVNNYIENALSKGKSLILADIQNDPYGVNPVEEPLQGAFTSPDEDVDIPF